MKLSPREVELVRSTFALLEPKSGVAALVFYQRLFAVKPALRTLVRGDIEAEAAQLMVLLRAVTELADQPQALRAKLTGPGARLWHAGATHGAPVGEVLLWSLEATLGPQFTPEARAAWAALVVTVTEEPAGRQPPP